jgi:hypothetical protein
MLKIKKIQKSEFQGVLLILVVALILTGLQTFQLYSVKQALAREGLGAVQLGGGSSAASRSSLPDQVGGCFRG